MTLAAVRRSGLEIPILGSLLLHLLFLPLFGLRAPAVSADSASRNVAAIPVRLIHQKVMDNLDLNGQVVDVIDNSNVSTSSSKDARFLSDRNRTVDRETQARTTGLPQPGSAGAKGTADRMSAGGSTRRLAPGFGRPVDLSLPQQFLDQQAAGSRQAAISPSNYLPEISYGNETALNTREYVFSTFFVRMKRQMEANWDPLRWVKSRDQRVDQYVTALRILLKPDGYLDHVELVRPSGNRSLDEEAMEAVRSGAPFLNPPRELVGDNGKIEIGPWHFIVSLMQRF